MEIITTRHGSNAITWQELRTRVHNGLLVPGDQLVLTLDGGTAVFDVIGIDVDLATEPTDDHLITIQPHDLILEEMPFDKDGSNQWEHSSLRKYLNSNEFAERFGDLWEHIVWVTKDCDGRTTTSDRFFLLSKDEVDPEKTIYPYYRSMRNRVKFDCYDRTDWYWLRSAYRGHAYGVWYVGSTGSVGYGSASYAGRCAPACVVNL